MSVNEITSDWRAFVENVNFVGITAIETFPQNIHRKIAKSLLDTFKTARVNVVYGV